MDNVPTYAELRKALRLVSHDEYGNRRITREMARLNGLPHFFTGSECSNGHVANRLVRNGNCVECLRLKN